MKRILPFFLLLAACSVEISPQQEAEQSTRVAQTVATLMPQESVPEPTIEPTPRWNFLILGIDKAYWRDSDPKRPHTDYMMLVSIQENQVTLVQIPRNTYVPIQNIPADFAFGLYSEGGLGMIEGWVEQALGIPLIGSVAMRMDDFVTLVDDLGGLTIGGEHMDGLELLTYTRFNLFDLPGYDAEGKHFLVASALAERLRSRLTDPESAFGLAIRYLPLVETDLDPGGMVDFLFSEGLPLVKGQYSVQRVRLEDALCYDYIPFENPGTSKGLLVCPDVDLHDWVEEQLQ